MVEKGLQLSELEVNAWTGFDDSPAWLSYGAFEDNSNPFDNLTAPSSAGCTASGKNSSQYMDTSGLLQPCYDRRHMNIGALDDGLYALDAPISDEYVDTHNYTEHQSTRETTQSSQTHRSDTEPLFAERHDASCVKKLAADVYLNGDLLPVQTIFRFCPATIKRYQPSYLREAFDVTSILKFCLFFGNCNTDRYAVTILENHVSYNCGCEYHETCSNVLYRVEYRDQGDIAKEDRTGGITRKDA